MDQEAWITMELRIAAEREPGSSLRRAGLKLK
jgi:hypothetical protein